MDSHKSNKRKSESRHGNNESKKAKTQKKWVVPRKSRREGQEGSLFPHEPEVGDIGIWVTCDMHKEARSVSEIRPLFEEHAARLYELNQDDDSTEHAGDVEDEIAQELADIRKEKPRLFRSIKIDTQCLLFFKTSPPIDPVQFVTSFCKDVAAQSGRKQTRAVRRLTPVTLVGKANEKGIDEVAAHVLAPHFHGDDQSGRKFAIRVNLRNHATLKRDDIIRQVATAVGPGHHVDLKNYDLLILVEIYRNTCGMSVVGNDYEALKRFNISEIYSPNIEVDNP